MAEATRPSEATDLHDVDVATVVRERARREQRVLGAVLPCYAIGLALLHLEPAGWTAAGWARLVLGVLAGTALVLVLLRLGAAWERGRRARLAEHAVLQHLDPGLGRRQDADRAARRMSGSGWTAAAMTALLALQAATGDFHQPGWAAGGIVLLVVALALFVPNCVREARAGRRWLADPPGPPRD